MATHSSIFAWRIPWREKPGGLLSMRSQRVRYDWAHTRAHVCVHTCACTRVRAHIHTHTHTHFFYFFPDPQEPRFCLEPGVWISRAGPQWVPKKHHQPGKKQCAWKRKQYLGIRERWQRQGMVLGELKRESGCWSINLGHINSQHWLDYITFFLHRCQVIAFGAGFFPPIFACPGHRTKWDCHAGMYYKGAVEEWER